MAVHVSFRTRLGPLLGPADLSLPKAIVSSSLIYYAILHLFKQRCNSAYRRPLKPALLAAEASISEFLVRAYRFWKSLSSQVYCAHLKIPMETVQAQKNDLSEELETWLNEYLTTMTRGESVCLHAKRPQVVPSAVIAAPEFSNQEPRPQLHRLSYVTSAWKIPSATNSSIPTPIVWLSFCILLIVIIVVTPSPLQSLVE